MVIRSKIRTPLQIVNDYLNAKTRKDFLGHDFVPTPEQIYELLKIVEMYGEHALSRSRNHKGLSERTLSSVIPRFLKFNLNNFVERLEQIKKLSSTNCWEYYVITYGDAEAKKFWDQKAKKCTITEDKIGKEAYEQYVRKNSRSVLNSWIEKYGEGIASKMYKDYRINLSKSRTLQGYIERFGEELGKLKHESRYKNKNSSDYTRYANKVHRLSNKTYEENKDIINPEGHKRTLCGIDDGWQLDHIMTVRECFDKGITAEEASSISNLRMLPWKTNLMRTYGNKV
jgi:hypothetical protein